jgi:hypothetical protein
MRLIAQSLIIVVAVLATGLPARAQTGAAAGGASNPPRWELEMYGGLSLGRLSSGGSIELPGPGAPIATSSPIYPSWRVPTWFLGDGAAYLNRVAEQLAVGARISPLDAALSPAALNDAGNFAVGARVRHPLRGRFSIEGGMDVLFGSGGVTQELIAATAAARASFEATFGQILATGPFTGISVSATGSEREGSTREIALTGALVTDFAPWGGFSPFLVTGGGVLIHAGDPPAILLEGRYRAFVVDGAAPAVPIDETDRLTVEYGNRTAFVAVLGGGVHRTLSPSWGLRIDARVLLGPRTTRVALHADPAVAAGTPAGVVQTFTYPSLQLSNNPSTGRDSTLSGSLDGFDAFTGGWQTRFRLTAGLVVRF